MEHLIVIANAERPDVKGVLHGMKVDFTTTSADVARVLEHANGSKPGVLLDTRGMEPDAIAQIVRTVQEAGGTSPVMVYEGDHPPAGGNAYVVAEAVREKLLPAVNTHLAHRQMQRNGH